MTHRNSSRASSARWGTALSHAGLIAVCIGFLLPLLWTLRSALLPETVATLTPPQWGPLTLENFRSMISGTFGAAFLNSLLVGASVVALGLPLAASLGYALARFRVGGEPLRFAVLATQMLPPLVLALPFFAIFRTLGLVNSLLGLVLAYLAFALPFMSWLLVGFFAGIPVELEEAAALDGATPLQTFWRIVIPLATPGLFAAGVLGFILSWNEFLFALLLTGRGTQTVPVALSTLVTQRGVLFSSVAAGIVLSVLPVAVFARIVDRYLVAGLTFGAVK